MRAILAVLILIASLAHGRAETVIAVLSDSRGSGAVGFSFVPFLKQYMPQASVTNFSVSSRTLSEMDRDYGISVSKYVRLKPTDQGFLIILAGINDASKNASSGQIYAALTSIRHKAELDRWQIVMLTDPCGPALNERQQAECDKFNAEVLSGARYWHALIRLDQMMRDHASENYIDGIHFSERGAERIAHTTAQALEH